MRFFDHTGDIFYLNSPVEDSMVGSYLNSRFSMFSSTCTKLLQIDDETYKTLKVPQKVTYEPSFYTKSKEGNGSFSQLFLENDELHIRVVLQYYRKKETLSYSEDYLHIGFKERVSDISYGSVVEKFDKFYSFNEWYQIVDVLEDNPPGNDIFQLLYTKGVFTEKEDPVKGFVREYLAPQVIIIYFGPDQDYYFASTDLKIDKDSFCLEAISNTGEKVILRSRIFNDSMRFINMRGQTSSKFDWPSSGSGLFNSSSSIERLSDSSISFEDFSLHHDKELMSTIDEYLKQDRSVIDNKWSEYHWHISESLKNDVYSEQDPLEQWLDSVHEAGFDDNDLV